MKLVSLTMLVAFALLSPAGLWAGIAPPLFSQCPAVGMDSGCGVLITINPDLSLTFKTDPSQPPYEGEDDALIGVQNNSDHVVKSIPLTGFGIFAMDGDGIGDFCGSWPGGCVGAGDCIKIGCKGYDGLYDLPFAGFLTRLKKTDDNNGFVFFDNGLNPNSYGFFSLEHPPFYAPEPGSLLLLGSGVLGLAGVVRRGLLGKRTN